MEFMFETVYDRSVLTVMARALRKTVRKKHSRRSHVIGWIIVAVTLLLSLRNGFAVSRKELLTWAIELIMVLTMLFEDRINGRFAHKRMLPGTEHTATSFDEEGYTSVNAAGTTRWSYENVQAVAETEDYFVFVLNFNHAQIYDKRTLSGGTEAEVRMFLEEKMGKPIAKV